MEMDIQDAALLRKANCVLCATRAESLIAMYIHVFIKVFCGFPPSQNKR